jgi:radical SAM protein with 4Fe4S-binding SPASM domain
MSQVNVVKIYRTLNDAQKDRIANHAATVVQLDDGTLHTTVDTIITPSGLEKQNKLITIVPSEEEQIKSFRQAKHLFSNLIHMNLLLTNACNLSCSYCYEQHKKDYGRFTVESVKQSYDWLSNINKQPLKILQFFGGEPLIHKPLIQDFINKYDDELNANWNNYIGTGISICTNGLLLDDDFIDMYFSKKYTYMLISLDTMDLEKDYREITQKQLDTILHNVERITKIPNVGARLTIRCTLSEETADTLNDFIESIYAKGVKRLIVHPLVLDSRRGYIRWSDANWNTMRNAILGCLDKYQDLTVLFSEGVGEKQDNNCMVGSDMIAIDGSGDFSGCYFFTNQKAAAHETILGNILQDRVYVDRYTKFQKIYNEMFEVEEQCKTCDYQNMCYQCPAGNIDTGPRMFRPDDMCQEIVKWYLDLQADVAKKQFRRLFEIRLNQLREEGEQKTIAAGADYMLEFLKTGSRPNFDPSIDRQYKPYKEILLDIWAHISGETNDAGEMEAVDLYKALAKRTGMVLKVVDGDTPEIRVFYLQLISTIIFNEKNHGFN